MLIPGNLAKVVSHHLGQLKKERGTSVMAKHPTIVSAIDEIEGFAEGFTIYQLGKYGADLRTGLSSFSAGIARFEFLLKDFKQRDPVGYLLMAKLDQYLRENDPSPEAAVSWTTYQRAQQLIAENGGVITPEVEREWTEMEFDFSTEEQYLFLHNTDVGSDETYISLYLLHRHDPHFYPLLRDLAVREIFSLSIHGLDSPLDFPLDQLLSNFSALILENPFDSKLNSALGILVVHDPIEPVESANTTFLSNPLVLETVGLITHQLSEQYPEEKEFVLYHALSLKQRGHYELAIEEFEKLIQQTTEEDSQIEYYQRSDYLKHIAQCLTRLGRYEEAEEIYIGLINNDPSNLDFVHSVDLGLFYESWEKNEKLIALLLKQIDKDHVGFVITSKKMKPETFKKLEESNPMEWAELKEKVKVSVQSLLEEGTSYSRRNAADLQRIYGL